MTSFREKIIHSLCSLRFFCGCYSDVVDLLFNSDVSCIWCFQPDWKCFTYNSVKEFVWVRSFCPPSKCTRPHISSYNQTVSRDSNFHYSNLPWVGSTLFHL